MDSINVGILSLLPPLIAIFLALISKEVIPSLVIGILSGSFIYSFSQGNDLVYALKTIIELMGKKIGDNASILLFLGFLGSLIAIITIAGGSFAYGDWASKKIKTKRGTKLSTALLGFILFIDDYFNCLTIGTVMKPVYEKNKVSREKLAYIIDSTAAPICIIAPISSWAASIISQINDSGVKGSFAVYLQSIPYNFYAILTIIMVFIVCFTNFDFGVMKKFESSVDDKNDNLNDTSLTGELANIEISKKGKVYDLLIPIIFLILSSIFFMLHIGGFFTKNLSLIDAFGATDAGLSLAISSFLTLIITFLILIPRKVITYQKFMEGISIGIKTMVPAFIILILAWTISGICRDLLSAGTYVSEVISKTNFQIQLLPALIFIISGFLAFSMGTSWGTFAILIPIVVSICYSTSYDLTVISISAVLSGAVFGDHCSPISDTTIMSSTGAQCSHINHVSSQIPYALVVSASSFIGYVIAGFTQNIFYSFMASIISLALILFVIKQKQKTKNLK